MWCGVGLRSGDREELLKGRWQVGQALGAGEEVEERRMSSWVSGSRITIASLKRLEVVSRAN